MMFRETPRHWNVSVAKPGPLLEEPFRNVSALAALTESPFGPFAAARFAAAVTRAPLKLGGSPLYQGRSVDPDEIFGPFWAGKP
jgi:hypothetical protein